MKNIYAKIASYTILAVIFIIVISFLSAIGGVIMGVFGFKYKSFKSIVLFFVFSGILGFPMEVLSKAIPKSLLKMGFINKKPAIALFMFLDASSSALAMTVVDFFMTSVSASDISIIIISIILALFSLDGFDKT